jgi:lambda family phage minor tail protein L|tara:strand:- start:410 stop:2053 length:1644 start_codon:yes stop_codon:yes gene_type:complete
MSLVFQELLNSSPFAIIELFEIELFQDIHGSTEKYRFYSGTNFQDAPGNIVFDSQEYFALPVEADGFEYKGDGTLPRPTLRFANVNAYMTSILLAINVVNPHNDLNGARVKRTRTLTRFLDAVNWQNGVNPYGNPDPGSKMPDDIYYIDRKTQETRQLVEFELSSSFDLANVSAPKRQAMQNLCQWKYKSKECGYSGDDEFTATGVSITRVAATNFAFSSGQNILSAGSTLQEGSELVSSNGWFRMHVERDGALNIFIKNDPTGANNGPYWRVAGIHDGDNYSLVMQNDGNLVLYNDKYAKTDYPQSVTWSPQVERVATASGASLYQPDGNTQFYPDDVSKGRSAALGYELVGSQPSASDVGTTTTAQKTFSDTHPILGVRTITVTFTLQANALPDTHYSGAARAWNGFNSVAFNSATGFFRSGETFIASVDVSSDNPFRNNHPEKGTLTETGVYLDVQTAAFTGKQLRLKDDGVLVVEDTDGSDVTYSSGTSPVTSEPYIQEGTDIPIQVAGVCGKRISDCKLRFPNGDAHGGLPFGSFPALGDSV